MEIKNGKQCRDCVHFRQHYYLSEQYGFLLDCGYCVTPRLKHRKASAKVCSCFTPWPGGAPFPDREKIIRYLTTEVLQHILSLELPPEIDREKMIFK